MSQRIPVPDAGKVKPRTASEKIPILARSAVSQKAKEVLDRVGSMLVV